jgi:hypothetical protein
MTATLQPLVTTKGATTPWRFIGKGYLSHKDENKKEWAEFDSFMTTRAEEHFHAMLHQFLYIPVTDRATLAYFFETNTWLFEHDFPVPLHAAALFKKTMQTLWNAEPEPLEKVRLRVKLNIMHVGFTPKAITGIKERLTASIWTPASLTGNNDIPHAMVDLEFQRIVKLCCATVRKPLSYLHRGIYPPAYLLSEKQIHMDPGLFSRYSEWEALLFREVWKSLFRDGSHQIRFGPKARDFFCGFPRVWFWDDGCRDIKNKALEWAASCTQIRVPVTGTSLDFGRTQDGDDFAGVCIMCDDIEHIGKFMLHIWAAKVISYKTKLDENLCRQMLLCKL